MSSEHHDDSRGVIAGLGEGDEEERMFVAALKAEARGPDILRGAQGAGE
jgi:hypothetical protein